MLGFQAKPDETTVCIYADGSAIYDAETTTWHYLVQVLDVGGKGGWSNDTQAMSVPATTT